MVKKLKDHDLDSFYTDWLANTYEKMVEYTGLEHRQTLRACDFPCDLQIEIEN